MIRISSLFIALLFATQAVAATTLVVVVNETDFATKAAKENFEALVSALSEAPEAQDQPGKLAFYRTFLENMKNDGRRFQKALKSERARLLKLCQTKQVRIVLHTNANLRNRQYQSCDERNDFRGFKKHELEWQDFEETEGYDFLIENQPLLSKEIFLHVVEEGGRKDGSDYLVIKSHGGRTATGESRTAPVYLVGPLMIDVRKIAPHEIRERLAHELVEERITEDLAIADLRKRPEFADMDFSKPNKDELVKRVWRLEGTEFIEWAFKGEIFKLGFLATENGPLPPEKQYGITSFEFEKELIHRLTSNRQLFAGALVHSCMSKQGLTRISSGPGISYGYSKMQRQDGLTERLDVMLDQMKEGASFEDAFKKAASE